MDEQHTAARVVEHFGTERPAPRAPFDPANLLAGHQQPPPPYVPGAPVEVVREFDPADHLGDRGQRGAFNLGSFKPLVATIGGVEMVTVPAAHYADLLNSIAAFEAGAEVKSLSPVEGEDAAEPDGGAMAAIIDAPNEVTEAHGAALDDGHATEAHGAALDRGKARRHPRG